MKLSKGLFRIYTILATAVYLASFIYGWQQFKKADDWYIDVVRTGVIIEAVQPFVANGAVVFIDNAEIASGWAAVWCLEKEGYVFFANDGTFEGSPKIIQWEEPYQEFFVISDTPEFESCIKEYVQPVKHDRDLSLFFNLFLYPLLAIFVVYMAFWLVTVIVRWAIDGFKP